MMTWWPMIGETSLMAGGTLGLAWAIVSTSRRKSKFLMAAMPPMGQSRWFLLSFVSMSCYVTLITALGLASLDNMLPPALFWFLLAISTIAFASALLFPATTIGRAAAPELRSQEPPANPPLMPVRRSA